MWGVLLLRLFIQAVFPKLSKFKAWRRRKIEILKCPPNAIMHKKESMEDIYTYRNRS
jgi:hypothetical protein